MNAKNGSKNSGPTDRNSSGRRGTGASGAKASGQTSAEDSATQTSRDWAVTPEDNAKKAMRTVRSKVKDSASAPEPEDSPHETARDNSQRSAVEDRQSEMESARAEQLRLAERANDPERIRELISTYVTRYGSGDDSADASAEGSARNTGVAAGDAGSSDRSTGFDLVVRGRQVSCGDDFSPREVAVRNGKIVAIEPLGANLEASQVVDLADDETLIPGLVDTHVPGNEPGRTEWEGFASATRAAAAGGVTTILDLPLYSVPATVNAPAL
ncbi:MAG: amidohydrolase family protein, partial [Kocuria sp.]|nr:amidohydrolase family protein [Kocuria sp.]